MTETAGTGREPAPVRASELYELAVCPHRITLDRRLGREERAAPDEASALLLERGRAWEAACAERLGWPRPEAPPGDFRAAAAETEALMRRGVDGVYQGVLCRDGHLAIPDLLRRVPGTSRLGPHHYEPGDVKAGLAPRADQVLQVAYAGWLLEPLQGRAPERGFLLLGDGREVTFPLAPLRAVLDAARRKVERIASGEEPTEPYWSDACLRCRWRRRCLPEMEAAGDLSLVDGMTPTRRRVLRRHGVATVADLAAVDPREWREAGRPPLGLEALVRQARALLSGRIRLGRPFDLPSPSPADRLIWAERDPLARERAVLVAWREASGREAVHVLGVAEAAAAAARDLFAWAESSRGTLFHFGAETAAALEALAEERGVAPALQVALEARRVDLRARLRRACAYLPVRRYDLEEVDAALAGRPLPGPGERVPPAFVAVSADPNGRSARDAARAVAIARRRLEALARVLAWMRAPSRAPGGAR
ncbi:MAG: TM0106 family RecB-like putative nuclease [Acidobacteria bacterium]|nr:MAG: TM0106 family RecB-like putative nuclease [Acidobacteriota bacterium]